MLRFRLNPLRLAIIAIFASILGAAAQETVLQEDYDKDGKTTIKIESLFADYHRFGQGYVPLRVTIRNATPANRVWTLRFNTDSRFVGSMTYSSEFRLPADAGQEVSHQLLVPLPPKGQDRYGYNQLIVSVTSPGLRSFDRSQGLSSENDWPSIGISRTLADRNLPALNTETEKVSSSSYSGSNPFGSRFIAADLPDQWKGYLSLDALMLTTTEWLALAPGQQRAIREWVRLGGALHLYKSEKDQAISIPSLDLSPVIGFGKATLAKWDGKTLPATPTVKQFKGDSPRSSFLSENYDSNWGLQNDFEDKNFNPFLVVLLLIVFGVLVGPVNLFVWARPGKRQRMFITTPIVSLAACLLIGALIFLGDGIGGTGRRIAFVDLQTADAENRAFVVQEQVSRAGVLFGDNFEVDGSAWISPVLTRRSQWNRLSRSEGNSSYEWAGKTYGGDWFQSRSEQGQYLQAVVPSRSRVEQQTATDANGTPTLFSSLEFPVDRLIYFGKEGTVWDSVGSVTPGSKIVLKAASDPVSAKQWWLDEIAADFSVSHRKSIRDRWGTEGHFIAVSSDDRAGLINTLGSIRWKDDRVVLTGPVSTQSTPAEPETGGTE